MVVICEREKKIIEKMLPYVHIRRTVRSKSNRHKYYMEENRSAMDLLNKIRSGS